MNERIKEIAAKAGIYGAVDINGNYENEAEVKKFAELIVKECIRIPYAMWDKAELNADVAVKIEHRIREHFGVE